MKEHRVEVPAAALAVLLEHYLWCAAVASEHVGKGVTEPFQEAALEDVRKLVLDSHGYIRGDLLAQGRNLVAESSS